MFTRLRDAFRKLRRSPRSRRHVEHGRFLLGNFTVGYEIRHEDPVALVKVRATDGVVAIVWAWSIQAGADQDAFFASVVKPAIRHFAEPDAVYAR